MPASNSSASLAPPRAVSPRPFLQTGSSSSSDASSTSSSSRPSPSLHPSSFAPPFYNRPPTPLPPSPSLSSLLRPPFTPSRPTTPDSSDSEAIKRSSRLAQTPRFVPRVPTYEYYGFVLYVLSTLSFLLYLIWSFLPSEALEALGIHYYPSRWWALALPSFLVMGVVYIFVALAAYNTGYLTKPLGAIENIVDEGGMIAAVEKMRERERREEIETELGSPVSPLALSEEDPMRGESQWRERELWRKVEGGEWKEIWGKSTDAVMDVPLGGVCEVLYGTGRAGLEEEEEEEGDGEIYFG